MSLILGTVIFVLALWSMFDIEKMNSSISLKTQSANYEVDTHALDDKKKPEKKERLRDESVRQVERCIINPIWPPKIKP